VLSSTSCKRPESTCEDYPGTTPVAGIVLDSGVIYAAWDKQAVPTAIGFLSYLTPRWPNYIVTPEVLILSLLYMGIVTPEAPETPKRSFLGKVCGNACSGKS